MLGFVEVKGAYARLVEVPCCYWMAGENITHIVMPMEDENGEPFFYYQWHGKNLVVEGEREVVDNTVFNEKIKQYNKMCHHKFGGRKVSFVEKEICDFSFEQKNIIRIALQIIAEAVRSITDCSYETTVRGNCLAWLFHEEVIEQLRANPEVVACKYIEEDGLFKLKLRKPYGPKRFILANWKEYNLVDTYEEFIALYAILEAHGETISSLHSAVMNGEREFCGIFGTWENDRDMVKSLFDFNLFYKNFADFKQRLVENSYDDEESEEEYLKKEDVRITSEGIVVVLYY